MSKIKHAWNLLRGGVLFDKLKEKKKIKDLNKIRNTLTEKEYLIKLGEIVLGYTMDLDDPKTYCEKMNWLKLNDRKPVYNEMADKVLAKEFVRSKLGEDIIKIIPTYGVYDSFDEIDFDKLPDQFVLKCNHNSGCLVICKDKKTFDKNNAKKILTKGLQEDYYSSLLEWPYRDIKRKILAEEYMPYLGNPDHMEYKVTTCNGKFAFLTMCHGKAHSEFEDRKNDSYDINWNHMSWYAYYKNSGSNYEKPKQFDQIVKIVEKLSEGTKYLRVDLYIINDIIYFGEMTFYTWGGFIVFTPKEWDSKIGDMIKL